MIKRHHLPAGYQHVRIEMRGGVAELHVHLAVSLSKCDISVEEVYERLPKKSERGHEGTVFCRSDFQVY